MRTQRSTRLAVAARSSCAAPETSAQSSRLARTATAGRLPTVRHTLHSGLRRHAHRRAVTFPLHRARGRPMSIAVRRVTKRFGEFTALDNVSVAVAGGSLTALLGPSGSGKSTLLRVIAGLETPDEGDVAISGDDATGLPPQKRGVGFVFQHYAAFKHMTVRDNVAFGLTIRKRPKAEIARKVDDLLEIVGLDGFQH